MGVFLIHVVHGRPHPGPVRPGNAAGAVGVEAVVRQGLALLRDEDGQAVLAAAAQEEGEYAIFDVHRNMMPREAGEADGLVGLVGRDLAVALDRVLDVALRAQVLLVGAVGALMPGAVAAHEEQAVPADQVPPQQPLAELHQVAPGREQPRMAAGLGPEHAGLGVVGRAGGDAVAKNVPPPLQAMLIVAADAQTSSVFWDDKVCAGHPQGREDQPVQQGCVVLPCRTLDDVPQHHRVHVRIGAPGHLARLNVIEQRAGRLGGGLRVQAGSGGQADLKAQHLVHRHAAQPGELGGVGRDRPGQVKGALLAQTHDDQRGEELRDAGQVEEAVLSEGTARFFVRQTAVGREDRIGSAARHGQAGHNMGFLGEIADGIL